MTSTLQLEIQAVPGDKTSYNRLVVVPDIHTFWTGKSVDWTLRGIREVMRWCRFNTEADNCHTPSIIIGSPWITSSQYRRSGYSQSWLEWHKRHIQAHGRTMFYSVHKTTAGLTDRLGRDGTLASAHFYPQEFSGWDDLAAAWNYVFDLSIPGLRYRNPNLHYAIDLAKELAGGAFGIPLNEVKEDSVGEIVVLTGHTSRITARAFVVPRLRSSLSSREWLPF